MKFTLLICLLAFMACEKDIIDIGKCIYKAPLVKEIISDVIVAIATKDYSKLLPKIKESLPELIQIVLSCITDTKVIEDEKLEFFPPTQIPYVVCIAKCTGTREAVEKCYESCRDYKKHKY